MSSSVQNYSSVFSSLLPPTPSSSTGLIVEQPAQASQSTAGDNKSAQSGGADAGSFRDALKQAARQEEHDKHAHRHTAKSTKAASKPTNPSEAKSRRGARDAPSAATDSGKVAKRSDPKSARQQSADDDEAPDNAPADSGETHPNATAKTPHEAQGTTNASAKAPTPQHPAAKATAKPSAPEEEVGGKPPGTKLSARAVNPPSGDGTEAATQTDDPDPAQVDNEKSAPLTEEADPGSVSASTAGNAVTAQFASSRSSFSTGPDLSSADDTGSDSGPDSVTSTTASNLSFLDDLSSVAADPASTTAPLAKEAAKPATPDSSGGTPFSSALEAAGSKGNSTGRVNADTPPEPAPEARFAAANNAKIVTGVHGQLLPNGGAMHLRLDPPELGDLQISVHLRNGVMTAAFQTSNDEATRLLSHNLGNLKSMLEAQGVSVDKLHVQQGPKSNTGDSQGSRDGSNREPTPEQRQSDRHDQQRKEMIQKMWDKLAGKAPVDMVA